MSKKAADQALEVLQHVYPELRAGITNCRKISGSSTWSQHSWSAALDIHHKDWGYSTNPTHQRWLDGVSAFLTSNEYALSIRTHLWRVSAHYDHIHIDFWPRGYSSPPCSGSSHRTQYSTGKVVSGDPGPENGYITDPPTQPPGGGYTVEVHRDNVSLGDRGDLPQIAQHLLARHGFTPANTFNDQHQADGIFGAGSDSSTRDYQASAGLSIDGIIGPKTWSGLESV